MTENDLDKEDIRAFFNGGKHNGEQPDNLADEEKYFEQVGKAQREKAQREADKTRREKASRQGNSTKETSG